MVNQTHCPERSRGDSPRDVLAAIGAVSTATLASQLKKRGYDSVVLDRLQTTRPELKMSGFARTVRYVPYREDLFKVHSGGFNAQKQAVEQVRDGEILVIEARGDPTAGTIGDILALRTQLRGMSILEPEMSSVAVGWRRTWSTRYRSHRGRGRPTPATPSATARHC